MNQQPFQPQVNVAPGSGAVPVVPGVTIEPGRGWNGQIVYDFSDVPTLDDFAYSNAFIRGILGPFGSGKSSVCVAELVMRGLAQRPGPDGVRRTRFAVVRNTYGELRDTTMATVEQWLPEKHFGRIHVSEHRYVINRFANCEIEILFRALDKPQDVKHLLSLELTGAWVNEAREIPWAIIEGLQGRVGRFPAKRDGGPTWRGIFMDTNPPDADSKWYRFFEERSWLKDFDKLIEAGVMPRGARPEDYAAIFRQPGGLDDNAENLSNLPNGRGYYAVITVGKSAEWKKVYVDGQYGFVVEGKLVYPEFSERIHVAQADPVPGLPIIRSWDFGLTPACAFSQILPTGQWLCFDEMVSDNMSADEFSDEVIAKCNRAFRGNVQFEDWGDPAGGERAQSDKTTCFGILQAKNIMIEGSEQDPTLRQEAVRKPLRTLVGGEPQFILHPRCKVLRKGFMGGYHRRRLAVAGPERYSEKPEKNQYSHIHDALQYGMVKFFAPALVNRPSDGDDDWPSEAYGGAVNDATRSDVTGY